MPYNSFYSFALSGCVLIADPVALVYLVCAEHDWTCRCQSSRVARSRSSMCFHSRQQFVVHHMPTTAAPATASTVAIAFCRFAPTPFPILFFWFLFRGGVGTLAIAQTSIGLLRVVFYFSFPVAAAAAAELENVFNSVCWSNWQPPCNKKRSF